MTGRFVEHSKGLCESFVFVGIESYKNVWKRMIEQILNSVLAKYRDFFSGSLINYLPHPIIDNYFYSQNF